MESNELSLPQLGGSAAMLRSEGAKLQRVPAALPPATTV
jgi:hypothetical protein